VTEVEWLACADPALILAFLHGKVSDRKLRLFACACFRRGCHFIRDARLNEALAALEAFVEHAKDKDRARARRLGQAIARNSSKSLTPPERMLGWEIRWAADRILDWVTILGLSAATAFARAAGEQFDTAKAQERNQQVALLHDIFLHPSRLKTFYPAWLTTNVISLAQAIYEDRAFDRLPILGDALEDAGCPNAEMLEHCREAGEHVRGCWVVDLVRQGVRPRRLSRKPRLAG
jgi:hypothetical protein